MKCLGKVWISLLCSVLLMACQEHYTPKPRGFFRIDLPEKHYQVYEDLVGGCPFSFVYPMYGVLQKGEGPCWMDVDFKDFNARLHLTYIPISKKVPFVQLTEDARELAFKHTVKATGIDQIRIQGASPRVHGVMYDIKGNTASSIQFYLTDSTKHYIRGSLYFNEKPRVDSIQPVLDFLRLDMDRFIQDFKWKP